MPIEQQGVASVSMAEKRAGDADRSAVAEQLRMALEQGRLELLEYDERVKQAYAAKTYAELDELLADIPGVVPASRSQLEPSPSASSRRKPDTSAKSDDEADDDRDEKWSDIRGMWSGYGFMAILLTGIWTVTWLAGDGGVPYFWPVWPLGFTAIGMLAGTWAKLTGR